MFKVSIHKEKNRQRIIRSKIAVLGAARSGVAVSLLLAQQGARVFLSDEKSEKELQLPIDNLNLHEVKLETGGHTNIVLESDLICVSPGILLSIPVLKEANKKGIPIVGEIELSSWFCESPIIAITGSNGKTTTTTLTGIILSKNISNVIVAGNIGNPFADLVQKTNPEGIALLEISSFQLEAIFSFHPQIAVLMNLTRNHLDRYSDFDSYAEAKLNILKNMTSKDILVYNGDDEYLAERLQDSSPVKLIFSQNEHKYYGAFWIENGIRINLPEVEREIPVYDYQLPGPHNRYNMMVAALIATIRNIPPISISREIADFSGIEHRLEVVRKLKNITFINDSKATTVDSLAYALQSFDGNIVLIAGGKDKGGEYSKIQDLVRTRVRKAVLIGQAAPKIEESWKGIVSIQQANDLENAVKIAYTEAKKGDIVLLSPACSSFDMFMNYEERGKMFKSIVASLN